MGQFVPLRPPQPPRLWKMVLPDVLHCCFVHRHARKTLKTYLEFSFPGDSNDMNFSPARDWRTLWSARASRFSRSARTWRILRSVRTFGSCKISKIFQFLMLNKPEAWVSFSKILLWRPDYFLGQMAQFCLGRLCVLSYKVSSCTGLYALKRTMWKHHGVCLVKMLTHLSLFFSLS